MSAERIALVLFGLAAGLALLASAIAMLFAKTETSFFDGRTSTLKLIARPADYVRQPYAGISRALGVTALVFAVGAVAWVFVTRLVR